MKIRLIFNFMLPIIKSFILNLVYYSIAVAIVLFVGRWVYSEWSWIDVKSKAVPAEQHRQELIKSISAENFIEEVLEHIRLHKKYVSSGKYKFSENCDVLRNMLPEEYNKYNTVEDFFEYELEEQSKKYFKDRAKLFEVNRVFLATYIPQMSSDVDKVQGRFKKKFMHELKYEKYEIVFYFSKCKKKKY